MHGVQCQIFNLECLCTAKMHVCVCVCVMNMCKSTLTCTYYSAVLVKITPLRDVVHMFMYVLVPTVLYQRHAMPICSSPCCNSNSNPNNSWCWTWTLITCDLDIMHLPEEYKAGLLQLYNYHPSIQFREKQVKQNEERDVPSCPAAHISHFCMLWEWHCCGVIIHCKAPNWWCGRNSSSLHWDPTR